MSLNIVIRKQYNSKNLILVMFITSIVIFSLVSYQYIFKSKIKYRYTKGLTNKIIVLDAGHGGIDPGAKLGGIQEKDINMAIVRKLEKELKSNKIKVLLTREENAGIVENKRMSLAKLDNNLQNRKALAEDEDASLFVSVHVNSSTSKKPSGAVVYYQNNGPYHYKLALNIQNELNKLYSQKWTPKEANFVVVKNTEMPAVLVEVGFISNPKDRKFFTNSRGQGLIASRIYQGIKNYTEELTSK